MKTDYCTIYLVRHGLSEMNIRGLIGGHSETPLTEEGINQVEEARYKFNHLDFDNVYSSDLQRAVHTAEILSGQKVKEQNQLPGLRERHFGVLEARPHTEFGDITGAVMDLPEEERWLYRHAKNMETDGELVERVLKSLHHIADNNPGKTVLVVSHGGSIRVTLIKLGWGDHSHLATGSFKNVGYVELNYREGKFEVKDVEDIPRQQ